MIEARVTAQDRLREGGSREMKRDRGPRGSEGDRDEDGGREGNNKNRRGN